MIRNVTKPFLDIDMFVHLRTAMRPEGSLPLARENCLLAVADARLAAAGPRLWSVWAQGAAGSPTATTYIRWGSLEGSGWVGSSLGRQHPRRVQIRVFGIPSRTCHPQIVKPGSRTCIMSDIAYFIVCLRCDPDIPTQSVYDWTAAPHQRSKG